MIRHPEDDADEPKHVGVFTTYKIFFVIVAPCILKSTQFTHKQMHYLLI